MSFIMFLAVAFALGMRHALDPDHLVAVSTMVAEERRLWPAARLGLFWGVGHLLPIALVGSPVLLLRLRLPDNMEHVMDLGVGLLLIALGVITFRRLGRNRVPLHVHSHDHEHALLGLDRRGLITCGIGMVHGLAGSGAAAVLALTASPSVTGGVGYLLMFGLGTVAGMFATTLCIAAPALSVAAKFDRLHTGIRVAAGAVSIAMGLLMWYS